MAAEWAEFTRNVAYLVRLGLDECGLTFGTAPCIATGDPCYYRYPTCKDHPNYLRQTQWLMFSRAEGPDLCGLGALPYVADLDKVAVQIKPDEYLTTVGELKVKFFDTAPHPWSNMDKPYNLTLNHRETGAGSFWKNLFARTGKTWLMRPAEVYKGLADWPLGDYQLYFKGVITGVQPAPGECTITIKDRWFQLADVGVAAAVSDDNVLTAVFYAGGGTLHVGHANEFPDPTTRGGKCLAKIDDEYLSFTGRDTTANTLTGVVGGRYGSAATTHASGVKVQNVYVCAADGAYSGWDNVPGVPLDLAFLDLIVNQTGSTEVSGIPIAETRFLDLGATLTAGIDDNVASAAVTGASALPAEGVIMVDDEAMIFTTNTGSALTSLTRGCYSTSPASHDASAPVLISRFSDEVDRWWPNGLFKRAASSPKAVKDLVRELRRSSLSQCWADESGKISFRCATSPWFRDNPREIGDADNLITSAPEAFTAPVKGSSTEAAICTRATVWHCTATESPGDDTTQWLQVRLDVDVDRESENWIGREYDLQIFAPWVYRWAEAISLAEHSMIIYKNGAPRITLQLDAKDAEYIGVGDFLFLTTTELVGVDGVPRESVTHEVISKKRLSDTKYEFLCLDVTGGVDGKRYGVIAPDGTAEYDSATTAERVKYVFSADAAETLGVGADPAFLYQ